MSYIIRQAGQVIGAFRMACVDARLGRKKDHVAPGRFEEGQIRLGAEVLDGTERVVAGEPLASLRTPPHDRQYAALSIDRRNVLAGLELARQKLAEAERVAARDLAEAFAPQFRTLVRAAALAWVQWIRAARQLEGVSRELGPLYGYAGLDDPLPRSRTDDPADPSGGVAQLLRRLVDAKVIDPATDAEVLAGFAIALPDRPPVVPAAPPPKKQISFKQAMRSLGASLGYTRSGDDEA